MPVEVAPKDIDDACKELRKLKAEAKNTDRKIREVTKTIIDYIDDVPGDVLNFGSGRGVGSVKKVVGTRVSLDSDALLEELPGNIRDAVVVEVIDKKKLDAAVAIDEPTAALVDKHSTMTENAPYLRLSDKHED